MQEQLSVRIDSELRAWLGRRAAAEVRTVGALVRAILVGAMWADGHRPLLRSVQATSREEIEAIQRIPPEGGGRQAEAEPESAEFDPWDDLDIPGPLRRTPQT